MQLMNSVYAFFSQSSRRTDMLKTIVEEAGGKYEAIKAISQTRWLSG